MNRPALVRSLAAFALFPFTPAVAAERIETDGRAPRAAVAAQAPDFRLAAFVDGDIGGYAVRRKKGVRSVARAATGTYCITPSGDLPLAKIVPIVTAEWSRSDWSSVAAHWIAQRNLCPAGTIEVVTLAITNLSGGYFDQNDEVAFTIHVP